MYVCMYVRIRVILRRHNRIRMYFRGWLLVLCYTEQRGCNI